MPDAPAPPDDSDAELRVDYVFATPAKNEFHRRLMTGERSDQLVGQVNQAAQAAHQAVGRRDDLIRVAMRAGVDLDHLASATGLTIGQLHRINLTG